MLTTKIRINDLGPICSENIEEQKYSRIPNPLLFSNILMLWQFLDMIVIDWKRDSISLQAAIDNSNNDNEVLFNLSKAFIPLQPLFLKCLFSYVIFFVSLEGAYTRFYEELNLFNKQTFFQLAHEKLPKPTDYIKKVRKIRNISVAHIGTKNDKLINSIAAMMWQPMTLSKKSDELWNLDNITFGSLRLIHHDSSGHITDQSDDFEIKGIAELNGLCSQYLAEYDRVCSIYLQTIHTKLPIKINNNRYYAFNNIDVNLK